MTDIKYKGRLRLSIDIPAEQHYFLQERLPWGVKSRVMGVLVRDLINAIKEHGDVVIGALVQGSIDTKDISPILRSVEDSIKEDG